MRRKRVLCKIGLALVLYAVGFALLSLALGSISNAVGMLLLFAGGYTLMSIAGEPGNGGEE